VKSGKTLGKIRMEDILYFEGEKEYVRLVTTTERILIYRRLKDIQNNCLYLHTRTQFLYCKYQTDQ
jgi:DNA-binding LytR/AlgR family response regulator